MADGFAPTVEIIRPKKPDITLDGDVVTFIIDAEEIQLTTDGNVLIRINLNELKAAIGL